MQPAIHQTYLIELKEGAKCNPPYKFPKKFKNPSNFPGRAQRSPPKCKKILVFKTLSMNKIKIELSSGRKNYDTIKKSLQNNQFFFSPNFGVCENEDFIYAYEVKFMRRVSVMRCVVFRWILDGWLPDDALKI
jgi:hypothetical protein